MKAYEIQVTRKGNVIEIRQECDEVMIHVDQAEMIARWIMELAKPEIEEN